MLFAKDVDAIACGVGAALLLADEAEHGGRTGPTSSARLPQPCDRFHPVPASHLTIASAT